MRNFLNILVLLSFGIVNGHTNVIFRKSYGNVNLLSSTSYYTEEVNKNIIMAKYVELLLKEMNYKDVVNLSLIQEGESKFYAYFGKAEDENEGLNIMILEKQTNIFKALSFVENVIANQQSLDKAKDMFSVWYNSKPTKLVESVTSNKINRPDDVPEIRQRHFFDYFYENGIYHILSFQNREVIEVAQLTNILQFNIPTPSLLFIFTEMNSLTIISANYKYDFEERQYHPTSETVKFDFKPEWEYSFRPYSFKQLGQKYITIESIFGDKVSLYNVPKKKFTQDLLAKFEE